MSTPFVGQITMFAGSFAPRGWAFCNGQLLAVGSNDPLFSLLGTIYGGDGETTFGLPDLRGRIPIHMGQGPGLSPRPLGAKAGEERVVVTENQLPSHTHPLMAALPLATDANPQGNVLTQSRAVDAYLEDEPTVAMAPTSVDALGGDQNHDNVMPFLCVHFIIALFGIFPSRF